MRKPNILINVDVNVETPKIVTQSSADKYHVFIVINVRSTCGKASTQGIRQ